MMRATCQCPHLENILQVWPYLPESVRCGLSAMADAAAVNGPQPDSQQSDPCLIDERSNARQGVPCEHGKEVGVAFRGGCNEHDRSAAGGDADPAEGGAS